MKKIWLMTLSLLLAAAAFGAEGKPLRVLIVGNSFSVTVMRELPNIVDAQKEHALDITSMYIGGCSLERHVREYEKALKDPNHRPYSQTHYITGQGRLPRVMGSLVDVLAAGTYDVITIQQASPVSFKLDSWTPYGDKLVAILREKQPRAKLLIHQTWSYRCKSPLMTDEWKFTQEEMFKGVRAVCADRAKHFDCGVIPMGEAVQLWRRGNGAKPLSANEEEFKKYEYPKMPPRNVYKGDVVGWYRWRRRKKPTPHWEIWCDYTHLNPDGFYLQGCVWFAYLFGADAEKITYKPKYLTSAEAALIRRSAADAIAGKYE